MKILLILLLLISCSKEPGKKEPPKTMDKNYMGGMTQHFMKTFGLSEKRAQIIAKMARNYYKTYHQDVKGGVKKQDKTREEVMKEIEIAIQTQIKEQNQEKK